MKTRISNWLALSCALFAVHSALAQIKVTDGFGREVNDRGVFLADWQGHLMNPKSRLTLTPPSSGVSYPLTAKINATGTSRLMLNSPSTLSATGAEKTVTFNNASSRIDVQLTIVPDRAGGYGEVETYELKLSYAGKSDSIPIKVIDLDDDLQPTWPLVFDYRADDINDFFSRPGHKYETELAVKDWFYFFKHEDLDMVPAGDESANIAGNDWGNRAYLTNNKPYNGYWIFLRSIDGPYSTGYPNYSGKHFTVNGVDLPGRLARSSVLIPHAASRWTVSSADEEWHQIGMDSNHTDLYGLIMHEFGHAIVFGGGLPGFQDYGANPEGARSVVDYQGAAVPVDGYAHMSAWDRLSGHFAAYTGEFPVRGWRLTKLTILVAKEVGWQLREIGPFMKPQITTSNLPTGEQGKFYNKTLSSNNGGVPVYDWTIVKGALPAGLSLDRFTGKISGTLSAGGGKYDFTVQMKDDDELSEPVSKALSIRVSDNQALLAATMTSPAAGSTLSGTSVTFKWTNSAQTYWIDWGSNPGGWDLYRSGQITSTSHTINNLPTDGRTVYIRLSTVVNGQWKSNNYTYKAKNNSGGQVAPIVNVTKTTSNSISLSWNNTGAPSYYIYTLAPGGSWDLAVSGLTSTSYTLTGLKANTSYTIDVYAHYGSAWEPKRVTAKTAAAGGTLTNVAKGKRAIVSSAWGSGYEKWRVNDGSTSTRWASGRTGGNRWVYYDLLKTYNIQAVTIKWEAAYGKNYTIDVWTGSAWKTIKSVYNNSSLDNKITGLSSNTRYVRMNCSSAPYSHISLWEFEVYGK